MNNVSIKYEIYSGAGNDFVMINNIDEVIPFAKQSAFTAEICEKYFKQLDGAIFAEKPKNKDASVRMNYYNRDGSYGAMCGNGARCITRFAFENGLTETKTMNLEAVGTIYKAEILNGTVRISFPPPLSIKQGLKTNVDLGKGMVSVKTILVNVGSEHLVIFISENENAFGTIGLDEAKIDEWGRKLRHHEDFTPSAANVNFIQMISSDEIRVRTYERGVERETLACGTGIISSAIVSNILFNIRPPVKVLSQSGEKLIVDFKNVNGEITGITLEGSARKIGEGELTFDPVTFEAFSQK